jgi:hypothetical protein
LLFAARSSGTCRACSRRSDLPKSTKKTSTAGGAKKQQQQKKRKKDSIEEEDDDGGSDAEDAGEMQGDLV